MLKSSTREITITQSKGAFSLFKKSGVSKQDFDFEGIAILRQLLSNEKARLLHVIKTENPSSIYDLAKKLGRNFKPVSEDVKPLKRMGFIDLVEEKTKNRIRHKPKIIIDKVTIHINV